MCLKLTGSLYRAGRTNLDEFERAEIDLQKSAEVGNTGIPKGARSLGR